jgi:hypothetical protein
MRVCRMEAGEAVSGRLAAIAARTVGRRVQLAPHLDAWMRGDRYGTVVRVTAAGLVVELDRSRRRITLTGDDITEWLD